MAAGDIAGAEATLGEAARAMRAMPARLSPELLEEVGILEELRDRSRMDTRMAAKQARMEHARKNRKRGRG